MPLLGTAVVCTTGAKECTADQVCDADTNNCKDCEQGEEPDKDKAKCIPSRFYHFLSTTIKYNVNTSPRYNSSLHKGRQGMHCRPGL